MITIEKAILIWEFYYVLSLRVVQFQPIQGPVECLSALLVIHQINDIAEHGMFHEITLHGTLVGIQNMTM